jgi:uroporphyrinogen-III synthase
MTESAKAPLKGVRVLVGRARHQASELSAGLRVLGAEVIAVPFIEIRKPRSYKHLDSALRNISTYDWLILTSVNGVDAIAGRMKKLQIKAAGLAHLKIAAIGPATAQRIKDLGLKVAVVPEQYMAESVVKALRQKVKGKRVLLARAKVARDVIPRELRRLGAKIDVVEAYETVIPQSSRSRLRAVIRDQNRRPHLIAFTSSSTVRNFMELIGGQRRQFSSARTVSPLRFHPGLRLKAGKAARPLLVGVKLASIGPITSATLREFSLPPHFEAHEYTIPGLIAAIVQTFNTN